jgi:parallel beta-helix repeat protein
MKTARVLALAFAALALLAAPTQAVDYYVAPDGDDEDDGLTPGTAWETLVHAADEVGPGDTVHVADGDYEGFHLTTSGAPGSPIRFVGEGDAVEITEDNPTTPDGINLEGASYVIVENFEVNDRTRAGIRTVTADHVTIRNNRLGSNGMWGILTGFVDDLLIEGNEAHDSEVEHGIYVSNSCDRPVVRNNHIYDNNANGLHMNGDIFSPPGDGLIEEALVEGNVIHGNGAAGGSGINGDGVRNSVIRNNLLYDNLAGGITLYRIDGGGPAIDNLVVNNTVVMADNGRWAINIRDAATGNTVRNNILYNFDDYRGALAVSANSLPGFSSDYNAVIGRFTTDDGDSRLDLAEWQALGHDAHSFVATPAELFLVPGADFRLLPAGPAVDAGIGTNAPSVDLEGAPRPVGDGFDIGAYELQFPDCGNAVIDPPEQCEIDDHCTGDETCRGCTCNAPVLCGSGVELEKASLKLRADGRFTLAGRLTLPESVALDLPTDGLRVVVRDATDATVLDVTAPPGAGWTVKNARSSYTDAALAVRKATVLDKGARTPGLVKVSVKGEAGALTLPDPAGVVTTVLLAPADGCGAITWNGPTAAKPRCKVKGTQLSCR